MRLPLLVCVFGLALLMPARASEETQPGWFSRALRIVGIGKRERETTGTVRTKNLMLTMAVTPDAISLSSTRQLKIALALANRSRHAVQLEFPTTQRIEILIKDQKGKLVTQWSEDQSFENQPVFVTINPGERIEYNASIGTRDLASGRSYVVEGFFPNFEGLKATKSITPGR